MDSFAELRDAQSQRLDDLENVCFICGFSKDKFEKQGINFNSHVNSDHNALLYACYLIYLDSQPKDEFDGIEGFVYEQFQKGRTNWAPIQNTDFLTIYSEDEALKTDFGAAIERQNKKMDFIDKKLDALLVHNDIPPFLSLPTEVTTKRDKNLNDLDKEALVNSMMEVVNKVLTKEHKKSSESSHNDFLSQPTFARKETGESSAHDIRNELIKRIKQSVNSKKMTNRVISKFTTKQSSPNKNSLFAQKLSLGKSPDSFSKKGITLVRQMTGKNRSPSPGSKSPDRKKNSYKVKSFSRTHSINNDNISVDKKSLEMSKQALFPGMLTMTVYEDPNSQNSSRMGSKKDIQVPNLTENEFNIISNTEQNLSTAFGNSGKKGHMRQKSTPFDISKEKIGHEKQLSFGVHKNKSDEDNIFKDNKNKK